MFFVDAINLSQQRLAAKIEWRNKGDNDVLAQWIEIGKLFFFGQNSLLTIHLGMFSFVSCSYILLIILSLNAMASSVQFSSVQDGYAFGKAHMRSTGPYLRSFSNVAVETVPMLV